MPEKNTRDCTFHAEVLFISSDGRKRFFRDDLALEEPLEIKVGFFKDGQFVKKSLSITMRTPGEDLELAAGFLYSERLLEDKSQIITVNERAPNTVEIILNLDVSSGLQSIQRNFFVHSGCGICGKNSIKSLKDMGVRKLEHGFPRVPVEVIYTLPEKLMQAQSLFSKTGGLHAAALFSLNGELLRIREDVGRHNAVDKLIGSYFLERNLPLGDSILFLSGRTSFELVQKALKAGIPIVCSVGAPSSLAFQTAEEFGLTLLGFVREDRFNVYTDFGRLVE